MEKFIRWHKLTIGKIQNFLRINDYETLWLSWLKGVIMGVIVMSLLSGCYVYESSYSRPQYEHSTEIYYYNNLPYWGFYNDYYYYYGVAHMYPWWYYYTIRPHYTYNISTHVYVTCNSGYYVGKPRGPKFNNGRDKNYRPFNTVVVKKHNINKSNSKFDENQYYNIKNKNRTNIKTNTNKNTIKSNSNRNKSNINRNNINKNNIKINRSNTNRTNINKSKNTRPTTRPNTKKPR